jgi:hypothetical protein
MQALAEVQVQVEVQVRAELEALAGATRPGLAEWDPPPARVVSAGLRAKAARRRRTARPRLGAPLAPVARLVSQEPPA